mmetsp:Transcript_14367/g.36253  ORF Transcript_14367/g.36253 Transcript_14367/m.36253 type:complete len:227 (-) Transcript_14367:477-1157(-)
MSFSQGRLTMAPFCWMHLLAAREAKRRHSPSPQPFTVPTANAAVKQSPAPVVSTTFATATGACLRPQYFASPLLPPSPPWAVPSSSFFQISMEPLAPSLMRTRPPGAMRSRSEAAARSISSSVSVGRPVMRASSVSFGLRTVTKRTSSPSLAKGASTPPASRMTGTPPSRATRATRRLTLSGISRCSSTAPAPRMASACASETSHWLWFAPPRITMEFSPEGWRKM